MLKTEPVLLLPPVLLPPAAAGLCAAMMSVIRSFISPLRFFLDYNRVVVVAVVEGVVLVGVIKCSIYYNCAVTNINDQYLCLLCI